jgi:hypothetical protein
MILLCQAQESTVPIKQLEGAGLPNINPKQEYHTNSAINLFKNLKLIRLDFKMRKMNFLGDSRGRKIIGGTFT